MGLKLDYTTFDGNNYPDAYSAFKYEGVKSSVSIFACVWTSRENKISGGPPVDCCWYSFTLDLNSPDNIMKQGYNYLKTLPQFSGATDVLED